MVVKIGKLLGIISLLIPVLLYGDYEMSKKGSYVNLAMRWALGFTTVGEYLLKHEQGEARMEKLFRC